MVVTLNDPATVDISGGTPGIALTVGTAAKTAGYLHGSGGRRLVFAYEVQAADTDTDGVSVPADGIMLNGGRIVNADGAVFGIVHAALAANPGHRVDGTVNPQTIGVCGRTPEVRDALLARVQVDDSAVINCSQVTSAHLEALTGTLALFSMRITGLESGDFAGLSNLVTLYLSGNELTELPAGIFDGLANLTTLSLYNNDLRTLPVGVFDGLANLENLYLYRNDLRTLPDGVFVRLAKLSGLHMIGNPGTASFLPTADAGTDQEAQPSAKVTLDGSASSRVGPWGTNISYDWAVADGEGNPVTGITLTGADTATPSFVMPATESDGGFVFTLTVQGRGHSSRSPYKSTDSVRVSFESLGVLRVTSVALASAPTIGTTYGNGESIEVVVTFDEPATVTTSGGTPGIELTVGTAARTAGYLRGSGSWRLVFAYEVQAADTDTDGVSVPADSIIRNGGTDRERRRRRVRARARRARGRCRSQGKRRRDAADGRGVRPHPAGTR